MLVDIDQEYVDSIAAEFRRQTGRTVSAEVLQAAVKSFVEGGLAFMTEESELMYSNVQSFLEGNTP